MRTVSKRVAVASLTLAGLGAAAAITPTSAQNAAALQQQQFQLQLQQQAQQQAQQQQQLQDQYRQQAQQQALQQQQQQQAWQQQLQQQQQQQQFMLQQQEAYNYGYPGSVSPTLVGLAFWTGQPYTYWACQLGVDFQCPATRAAARASHRTAAPDELAAAPLYRHRPRHTRHRVTAERAR